MSLDDISLSDHSGKGLMLELPPADDLHDRLAALGITDRSRIIVYFGKDWVSPTTRVVFTLDAAGLGDRSALLDGGMPAWTRDGHTTTAEVSDIPKGGVLSPLTPAFADCRCRIRRGASARAGYALVDGRSRSFYDGIETGGEPDIPHKTGHIAGAGSLPFTEVTRTDLTVEITGGIARAVRRDRCQARRHCHRLLPYRPAGHGDAVRCAPARASRAAL